ncbi:hypothetical protein INT81_07405 [Riemerella anatipestifer]|nr:hypothetical protein [Riemerella anatipestifer]
MGEQMQNYTLVGKRGYLISKIQIDLFNYSNIQLDAPMRRNQKDDIPQFSLYKKSENKLRHFSLNFVSSL